MEFSSLDTDKPHSNLLPTADNKFPFRCVINVKCKLYCHAKSSLPPSTTHFTLTWCNNTLIREHVMISLQ